MDGRKIFGSFTIAIALFFFWVSVVGTWQEVSALRGAVAERQQLLDTRTQVLASIQASWKEYSVQS